MMLMSTSLCLVAVVTITLASHTDKLITEGNSHPEHINNYLQALENIQNSKSLRKAWKEHLKNLQEQEEEDKADAEATEESDVPLAISDQPYQTYDTTYVETSSDAIFMGILNCEGGHRSKKKPESIHRLRPGDIDVIGAMGDSLTAGNGVLAKAGYFGWLPVINALKVLTQDRGRSFSAGGDGDLLDGISTLPNILKNFNPKLKGFSVGSGDVKSEAARLNVAEPGNVAQDLPRQAQNLINKMFVDPDVDFENDWKMVTLFIGGNNLCGSCKNRKANSAERYIASIRKALDILKESLPRTFVNLVEIFDMSPVSQIGSGLICNYVHKRICSCGLGKKSAAKKLSKLAREYQQSIRDLVNSGRYDGKDDFTVVIQPFFQESIPPRKNGKPDLTYFAPDCFHFSEKGQNAAGKALWNSIITPVGEKDVETEWDGAAPVNCPATKFLPTKLNYPHREKYINPDEEYEGGPENIYEDSVENI